MKSTLLYSANWCPRISLLLGATSLGWKRSRVQKPPRARTISPSTPTRSGSFGSTEIDKARRGPSGVERSGVRRVPGDKARGASLPTPSDSAVTRLRAVGRRSRRIAARSASSVVQQTRPAPDATLGYVNCDAVPMPRYRPYEHHQSVDGGHIVRLETAPGRHPDRASCDCGWTRLGTTVNLRLMVEVHFARPAEA